MNPYLGDAPIKIEGKEMTLRYDWTALSRICVELGQKGQDEALAGDLTKLAVLVAIGLNFHHPEVTSELVTKASPPVMSAREAVNTALIVAHFGSLGVPEEGGDENPPKPSGTRLKRLWRRLFGGA